MPHVFNAFRQHRDAKLFPVVESDGEPIGVIHEEAVKNYAYLPFGRDLLSNRSYAVRLRDLISECPIADINTPAEKIIDTFATNSTHDGIIICRDLKYAGFLSAASMLALLAEKNLALARDQNPLTRLAGNTLIYEYVSQALSEAETAHLLVYLDFDYFKPFNDHYGFRHGDRVIVLFADLLRSSGFADRRFIGHVGGDDFFIGYRGVPKADALLELRQLVEKFKFDAQSFYDAKARSDGFILGQDRDGRMRRFPLLEVSAVAVDLAGQGDALTIDDISAIIAANKTLAKRAVDKVRLVTVSPRGSEGAQNEISAALPNIPQMISK
jgi:diguanylate cyclase (GGDEF)-like protein